MDYGPIAVALVFVVLASTALLLNKTQTTNGKRQTTNGKRQSPPAAQLSRQEYQQHWQRIESLLEAAGTDATRSAIMEADKLVDLALKQKNFQGQTMGDRLKDARNFFGNNATYQGLWQAHKMRNALAHELDFDLPKQIARQHLSQFQAALRQLGVL